MCSWEQPWFWLSWHSTLGHVRAEEETLGDTPQKTTGSLRTATLFIPTRFTEIPGARRPVSEKNPSGQFANRRTHARSVAARPGRRQGFFLAVARYERMRPEGSETPDVAPLWLRAGP